MLQKSSKNIFWESRLYKVLAALIGILIGVVLLASVSIFLRYRAVERENIAPVLLSGPEYVPAEAPVLGANFLCRAFFRLPWNKVPAEVRFQPGTGIQQTASARFSREKFQWGMSVWRVDLPLQAYRSGKTGSSDAEVVFSGGPGTDSISLKLPALSVQPPNNTSRGAALAIAGEIAPPPIAARRWWIYGVAALALLAIVLWIVVRIFRKKHGPGARTRSVWEVALDSIAALTESVTGARISPEKGISELTDIVRRYLEKRFRLRAEHQTTNEFLAELERGDSVLAEKDRKFLKSFLASADMVKFAKLPADRTLYASTAARAEELVRGTAPQNADNASGGRS